MQKFPQPGIEPIPQQRPELVQWQQTMAFLCLFLSSLTCGRSSVNICGGWTDKWTNELQNSEYLRPSSQQSAYPRGASGCWTSSIVSFWERGQEGGFPISTPSPLQPVTPLVSVYMLHFQASLFYEQTLIKSVNRKKKVWTGIPVVTQW